MLRNVRTLKTDEAINEGFDLSVSDFTSEQKRQLYQGLNRFGTKLKPYALQFYAAKKNKMNSNPGYGNPDFFVTGAFYQGITVEREGESIKEFSTDEKNAYLSSRDVWQGLGGSFKAEYLGVLRPRIVGIIKKKLFAR